MAPAVPPLAIYGSHTLAGAQGPEHHDPHMMLLGAGASGGRQRGDGFQLRLVLERGANRKSRIMHRRVTTHNVRANAPQ